MIETVLTQTVQVCGQRTKKPSEEKNDYTYRKIIFGRETLQEILG